MSLAATASCARQRQDWQYDSPSPYTNPCLRAIGHADLSLAADAASLGSIPLGPCCRTDPAASAVLSQVSGYGRTESPDAQKKQPAHPWTGCRPPVVNGKTIHCTPRTPLAFSAGLRSTNRLPVRVGRWSGRRCRHRRGQMVLLTWLASKASVWQKCHPQAEVHCYFAAQPGPVRPHWHRGRMAEHIRSAAAGGQRAGLTSPARTDWFDTLWRPLLR